MTNLEITNAYVGNNQVIKLYMGGEAIWPTTPPVPPVYSAMPLTFEITSPGVIRWFNGDYQGRDPKTIQYSKNGGGWTTITSNSGSAAPSISVVSGDTVQFRGDNAQYSANGNFSGTTAGFKVYGNIMSLIDSTGYTTATTLESAYTFQAFFRNCTGLTDASNLILPATTLSFGCYTLMFTTCTSLTTAPELPATTLLNSCYNSMFYNCTSLISAPELPATTLAGGCYMNMFQGCTSLNYIKCLATDISATNCTANWVNGVASSGTFSGSSSADWTIGVDGIPVGWTTNVDVLYVSPTSLEYNRTGSNKTITINSTKDWEIVGMPTLPSWLTISPLSGTSAVTTINVYADDNNDGYIRTGSIGVELINNPSVYEEIEVTQKDTDGGTITDFHTWFEQMEYESDETKRSTTIGSVLYVKQGTSFASYPALNLVDEMDKDDFGFAVMDGAYGVKIEGREPGDNYDPYIKTYPDGNPGSSTDMSPVSVESIDGDDFNKYELPNDMYLCGSSEDLSYYFDYIFPGDLLIEV